MPKSKQNITVPTLFKNPVFIVVSVVLLLVIGYFGYQKYQDWQAERVIRELGDEFPALVADVQLATGVELSIRSDCFTTQEKFSEGRSNCQIATGALKEKSNNLDLYEQVILGNSLFDNIIDTTTAGAEAKPGKYANCSYGNYQIGFGCIYVTRSSQDLAAELLNEERLNQRKNEILQELQNQ